jgi:hypothetical protein
MKLTEVVRRVAPAVVAFGSRFYPSETSTAPAFPLIIGTGFIVDKRGMVLTNQHVVDAIERFPAPARFVMLFPEPKAKDGQTMFGVVLRKIKAVNSVSSFESSGPFFGQAKPDFAFVQIDIQGLPFVEVCGDSNVLEVGLEVATLSVFRWVMSPLVLTSKARRLKYRRSLVAELSVAFFLAPVPTPMVFQLTSCQKEERVGRLYSERMTPR